MLLVTGIALNVVTALKAESVSRGAAMPVAFAGSSYQSDQSLGMAAAPVGIAFDVIGGAAAVAGTGLLIWRARAAKAGR